MDSLKRSGQCVHACCAICASTARSTNGAISTTRGLQSYSTFPTCRPSSAIPFSAPSPPKDTTICSYAFQAPSEISSG